MTWMLALLALMTGAMAARKNLVKFEGEKHADAGTAKEAIVSEDALLREGYAPIGRLTVQHRQSSARRLNLGTVAHLLEEAADVGGERVVITRREESDVVSTTTRRCASETLYV